MEVRALDAKMTLEGILVRSALDKVARVNPCQTTACGARNSAESTERVIRIATHHSCFGASAMCPELEKNDDSTRVWYPWRSDIG